LSGQSNAVSRYSPQHEKEQLYSQSTAALLLVTAFLVMTPSASRAEDVSLSDAIDAALQDNYQLRAAHEGVTAAEGSIQFARSNYLPTMDLIGSWGRNDGEVMYARFIGPPQAPGAGTDVGEFDSTKAGAIKLSQVAYAGGAYKAGVEAARLEHEIAKLDVEAASQDLRLAVTRDYYSVLLAEKTVEVARGIVTRSQENLAAVERLAREREALQADLLGAQAQLASDEHGLLKAENDLTLAKLTLNRTLGRELSAELELTDSLLGPAQNHADSEVVSQALEHNPALQRATLELELADAATREASSLRKPKLQVNGLYQYINNESFYVGSVYSLGVSISVPFFADFKAASGAVGSARAQRSAAEHIQHETSSGVQLQAREANRRLQQAYAGIKAAEKNVEYQKERYRTTLSSFGEQLATFSDVLTDHTALFQAELRLLGTQYKARLAEAELERAIGKS